jgi:hypothetical protein
MMAINNQQANAITGAVWLLGLAAMFSTHYWWPGIMFVIGVSALIEGLARRQGWAALQGSLWAFGIAIWVMMGYGIAILFVILAISVLSNAFLPPAFLARKPKPHSDPYLE